jgi:methyltransferase family protein
MSSHDISATTAPSAQTLANARAGGQRESQALRRQGEERAANAHELPTGSNPVDEYYRRVMDGHVYIRETVEAWLSAIGERVRSLGPRPRILELGSHAGILTQAMLTRWPDLEIVVNDDNQELLELARQRLSDRRVTFHAGPLESLKLSADLVVSIARHHHLPHDYLAKLWPLMREGAVYVLGDELCPEYCTGDLAARIAGAELIFMAGGYVLTSQGEVAAYRESRNIPPPALELEGLRQRALWRWYRFVVDHAVDAGYFDIAQSELQSTHDDLITGSDAEHKFSPLIVERQFALARFERLSKRLIGPVDDPTRQSMYVYEFERAGSA